MKRPEVKVATVIPENKYKSMKGTFVKAMVMLSLVSVAMACKSKKAVVATTPVVKAAPIVSDKKEANVKLLRSKNINFNTLSMKGKANLRLPGNENTVTVNVRMQRDQKIWMSITALLGIEVARAVITPDSIMVLNKLQNTYVRQPFSYIYRYTSRQVTFKMLQDVLTGNTINTLFNPTSILEQNEQGLWNLKGNEGTLGFNLNFNALQKPGQLNLNDSKAAQALKVNYGHYQKVNEFMMPAQIAINSMSGNKRVDIDFDFSKIESNVQVDFPFKVPKSYELIN
ncbi:DUF4292 domain-containing protein [Pedobacter quisquiliarum]|jgi:hypothetical protein|nr:DUF4292 domain-containing protein [Pedobacter quisquiliarum]